MARNPRHDILFEPIEIGPKVLRNRFYQVPHCTGLGSQKPASQARHRGVKAEGGWAAICTEMAPVSPDSDESPYALQSFWDADDAETASLMCEEIHAHGALAGVELGHAGAHAYRRDTRWPAIAPSQIVSDVLTLVTPESPKEMDDSDIERVKADWAQAARRAADVGFDIVYVYGGHSYLLGQFLSPFYNKRRDGYGGSFENRARLWLETLERVRTVVAGRCALAVRIAIEALGPAGVPPEESLAFIRAADDLVDLWDVNAGSLVEWQRDSYASRFASEGYQLEWTARARTATEKPIVGVGRLTNPDRMAEIVHSGVWDVIGAARPSIADPFLPRKIEEGRLDDVRECMGINVCVSRFRTGNLGCVQNATAGEEFRRGWHPERYDRAANAENDVLVVGAGAAGMECALVLGRRGMRSVHLVEAEADLGGTMRWIPRLPGLGEWGRLVNYRRVQLDKLRNVEVLTGLRLDASGVLDYGADLVVVATGSSWSADGLNGVTHEPIPGAVAGGAHVLTPELVMVGGARPQGPEVVVYDCDGYFIGPGLAELLALEGFSVELVTPLSQVAPFCDSTLEGTMLRQRLHEVGVRFRRSTTVAAIDGGRLAVLDEFGAATGLACDSVVLVTQRCSEDALYRQLAESPEALAAAEIRGLYRVGDCVAPRMLADAVFDGHRLGREIDSPDPSRPLPYLRERVLRSTVAELTRASPATAETGEGEGERA